MIPPYDYTGLHPKRLITAASIVLLISQPGHAACEYLVTGVYGTRASGSTNAEFKIPIGTKTIRMSYVHGPNHYADTWNSPSVPVGIFNSTPVAGTMSVRLDGTERRSPNFGPLSPGDSASWSTPYDGEKMTSYDFTNLKGTAQVIMATNTGTCSTPPPLSAFSNPRLWFTSRATVETLDEHGIVLSTIVDADPEYAILTITTAKIYNPFAMTVTPSRLEFSGLPNRPTTEQPITLRLTRGIEQQVINVELHGSLTGGKVYINGNADTYTQRLVLTGGDQQQTYQISTQSPTTGKTTGRINVTATVY